MLLARLLCLNPRVLLLDEPTRGIDVGAKAEVQGLIAELAEKGLAVVLISSELEEVVEGSDTVVVLRDGAQLGALFGDEITEDAIMDMIAERRRRRGRRRTDGRRERAGGRAMSAATTPRRRPEPGGPSALRSRLGLTDGWATGCASAASTSRWSCWSSTTRSPPPTSSPWTRSSCCSPSCRR